MLACFLALLPAATTFAQAPAESPAAGVAELLAELAIAGEEREECLALGLSLALTGDCEGGLTWLDSARSRGESDELGRRIATERRRLVAWIGLRDQYLAEVAESGRPLSLEVDGKRVASPILREGDELVLSRLKQKRVKVRALAPESLLASIPKERFAGANEWLKIYPYCVAANPKWKRLSTSDASCDELVRDAEEFYPDVAALGPVVRALEELAQRAPPADAAAARSVLNDVEALLALGRDPACMQARLPTIARLSAELLAIISDSLAVGELVNAAVSSPAEGTLRLSYDFSSDLQAGDWLRDDDYLAEVHAPLEPVTASTKATGFAPGPEGFRGNGQACWRHVLEFEAPLRVRYRLRFEPPAGPSRVFSFALGMMADAEGRHVRTHELGYLYVDEHEGPYTAVRPDGEAAVHPGRMYMLELAHDGKKVQVSVDGNVRAEAESRRKQGRVFLWVHSDLLISVPTLEIEGRVTPESLAALRARWARAELDRLGLDPGR